MPAKLRDELGERFTVTKGLDGCLAVYPEKEWEGLEERIRSLPMSKSRDLQRFFFSAAFDAELGRAGPHPAARQPARVRRAEQGDGRYRRL